eukprot:TRINITY_DN38878_c0_g1_i1.p1 TRINITY_DN38878_c0_g1~~TRINITY_DN38878_c0_g1_i1.p1  ORF type:complete len:113 (+),score=9.57 TRINITY_DN38878_c0_g1_i1:209-547(+)
MNLLWFQKLSHLYGVTLARDPTQRSSTVPTRKEVAPSKQQNVFSVQRLSLATPRICTASSPRSPAEPFRWASHGEAWLTIDSDTPILKGVGAYPVSGGLRGSGRAHGTSSPP